ncbi:MAG: LptE family protein [Elusimicrobiota bacterium]
MKRLRELGLLTLMVVLGGCSKYYYNPAPQVLPSYIQKIAIRTFANHTQQYGLEDKLTLAVQNEFNRDGRYAITTEDQADGVLIGDITRYILEPLSYDVNHVPTQYKLWIIADVTFYDKVKQQSLWKEPNMQGELRYYVASSGLPGAQTEEEARQTIWDELSRDIRTRTFEGFGTITGASDKAVPKSSPDQYNTVAPLPQGREGTPPPPPPENPSSPPPANPY